MVPKVEDGKKDCELSKKLATIVKNVPVKLDIDKAKTSEFDRQKLVNLFQELNFYSLIKRLPESNSNDSNQHPNSSNEKSEVKDFKFELIT